MLKVSAKLLQNPVLLSSSCSNISCSQMIPLVGQVMVQSSKRRKIGGIRVVLESRVQRRVVNKRDSKLTWAEGDTIERYEVDVVQGPYYLPNGDSQFDFVIEVPVSMVSSRTTAFDKISHQLHAGLLDPAPCYDRLNQPERLLRFTRSRHYLPKVSSFLSSKKARLVKALGMIPIIEYSSTPITVFSCDTEVDSTAYNFTHTTEMDDIGQLKFGLSSQQMVLGGAASLNVEVLGLSPKTTVHNITISLVQLTKKATSPSKYSSTSSSSVSLEDQSSDEVVDGFQLHTFGVPWPFMHTRPRPYRGSYIWRGAEAGGYTTDRLGLKDLQADRITDNGFELSTILTIPSPIIGAMASTTGCDPAFATVSHRLDVRVSYSVLGLGPGGIPLDRVDDEPLSEGVVRNWTLEKSLDIHSDLSSATATAAPPYLTEEETTHHCISVLPDLNLRSTKAYRSTSLWTTRIRWMYPVRITEADLRERTQRHWDETGGLCACFNQSERCDRAWGDALLRRREVLEK